MGRRSVAVGVGAAFALLLLTVLLPTVRDRTARAFGSIAGPVERWGSDLGRTLTGWWPGRFAAENRTLTERYAAGVVETSRLTTQLQEIRELARLSEALGDLRLPTVAARVLVRNPDPAVQALTIDRGRADGITEGSAVLAGDGLLLGRVHAVGERTAQVRLLTDPGSRLTVEVGSAEGSVGVLTGDRGTTALLSNVRREATIAPGQSVRTAGIDAGVPRGLAIGSVAAVTTRPADLFQSATVLLPTTERTPRTVLVLRGETL